MLELLQAEGWRNLDRLEWRPAPGAQLLLGDNGAGKTSLLEAIYLLATTRSFRTSQISDGLRHGADGFHLLGEVVGEARQRLEISLVAGQRQRRINGSETTLAEHLAVLPAVAWTARDGELVSGPPEERRRFLDRGVIGLHPRGLETAGRYRRVLHQKRRALLGGQAGLGAWNELLARHGAGLMSAREEYVHRLRGELHHVLEACELPFGDLKLTYRPSLGTLREPDEIFRRLEGLESRERQRQRPLAGPHLDDLEISWGDQALKRVASAGEKKAFGLALLAAHGRVLRAAGHRPVYLLDDVDTELSRGTLEKVWPAFAECGQLIASSNRPEVWAGVPVDARWVLRKGVLEEVAPRAAEDPSEPA